MICPESGENSGVSDRMRIGPCYLNTVLLPYGASGKTPQAARALPEPLRFDIAVATSGFFSFSIAWSAHLMRILLGA